MLEVREITKNYGKSTAIHDISFTAHQGEIVGLIGHNGSGKSTTMNLIAGYFSPTSGQILIDGKDVVEHSLQARCNLGYMPEVPPLYPEMKVDEQLNYACHLRGLRRAERKSAIEKACCLANISEVHGRLIRNLSKGYRQRVGLAQALIGDPPLLIFDEPTSGLDPKQILEVRQVIRILGKTHTVLLSSHILSEVAELCDRLVVLSNGQLVADATPPELISQSQESGLYRLQLDGPALPLIALLRQLPQISRCELDAANTLLLWTSQADVVSLINPILRTENRILTLFEPVRPGLEEVFLRLTQDNRYAEKGRTPKP